jgi:hypothetical protein
MSGEINDAAMQNKLGAYVLDENNMATVVNTTRMGQGAGTPGPAAIIAASEQVALVMDDGDEFYWKIPLAGIPFFDPDGDIRVRAVIGSIGGAGDLGLSMGFHIKGVASGEAMSDAKASADGSITWPTTTLLGVDKIQELAPMALGVAGVFADDLELICALTCIDMGDAPTAGAGANEIHLLHAILEYQLQLSHSSGLRQRTV